ncbi:uncharacterized protein CG45076-like isoform X2 [Periplaneta americana]|uniref:uncharacterized protein CG45076-like isoform X2 n=1 Tax=Periplaneta americana TaxID=6978 RepID=UPI0037E9A454
MVYESDFYTTRRPYTRPTITSYSVTAQTFHHSIPFVAHKRLTVVTPPVHTVRVRPSVILAEIDRINRKVRPSLAYQPAEDYLNSRSAVSFDDETRSIRAQTAALLKRIHEPLPRATKTFPISVTRYQEPPIPERITSDAYIHRLLGPTHNVKQEILSMSHYDEPAKRLMGKGHLACVSFAGGRAFPRRKNLFVDDDRVKNDVKYLSLYKKNRDAAENPPKLEAAALSGDWFRNPASYTSPPRSRPISRFYRPAFVPDDNASYQEPPTMPIKKSGSSRSQSQPTVETPASIPRAERQASLKEEPLGEEFEDTAARMNRRKKKKQEEARLAEEEKLQETARQAELARQEKMAQEAAAERQKELEKKAELARQAEEEAARKAEAELQAELERQEAERKAEVERQAELERQEAERKAEAERQEAERKAEAERQEAERKAEAERQAELERQEAERKAEAERQAELERQEVERKAEEERQAELERQEAERKAEAERQAELERQEAERKAEEERQAELKLQEELAKQEAEAKESAATEEAPATGEEGAEPVPKDESQAEAPTEEVSATPIGDISAAPAEDKPIEIVPTSPTVEEESGPEPVVEEPLSPGTQQESRTTIEEVHDVGIAEEPEEE